MDVLATLAHQPVTKSENAFVSMSLSLWPLCLSNITSALKSCSSSSEVAPAWLGAGAEGSSTNKVPLVVFCLCSQ